MRRLNNMASRRKTQTSAAKKSEPVEPTVRPSADVIPGSLASFDTTLPPTPLKQLLAADGASVYVLSADQALINAVETAAGDQYPVQGTVDWVEVLGLVESETCNIVLLDADLSGAGLHEQIQQLHAASNSVVVLVAAPRETAQQLIGLLSDRSIHRLLIKPAAVGITKLLLDSAVSRYLQLRDQPPERLEPQLTAPVRSRQPVPTQSKLPAWVMAVALVSLLIGAIAVSNFVPFGDDSPGPQLAAPDLPASESAVVSPSAIAGEPVVSPDQASIDVGSETPAPIEQSTEIAIPEAAEEPVAIEDPFVAELDAAAAAIAAGRIAPPATDSALELLQGILEQAPEHEQARALLGDVAERLYQSAEQALLAGRLETAVESLGNIRIVQPNSSRLAFLEAQLARALAEETEPEPPVGEVPVIAPTTEAEQVTVGEGPVPEPVIAGPVIAEPVVVEAAETPEPNATDTESFSESGPIADPADEVLEPAPVPTAVQAPPSELASLVILARTRLDQGLLIEPAGDSARDYVDRAIAIQPDAPDALALRSELAAALVDEARVLLEIGDLDAAEQLVEEAFVLGADRDSLLLLDLDLTAQRERAAQRQQAQILARARAQLSAGRLITPEGDGAIHHLQALREQNATIPGIDAAWDELSAGVVDRARAELDRSAWAATERWLDALAQIDPSAPELSELTNELNFGRNQERFLREPVPTTELTVLETVPAEYPLTAQQRGIEGWVDVEFIVDRTGRPTNMRVVDAEPAGRFETSALTAIDGYRFAPFELDGALYERLARVRIRFVLE